MRLRTTGTLVCWQTGTGKSWNGIKVFYLLYCGSVLCSAYDETFPDSFSLRAWVGFETEEWRVIAAQSVKTLGLFVMFSWREVVLFGVHAVVEKMDNMWMDLRVGCIVYGEEYEYVREILFCWMTYRAFLSLQVVEEVRTLRLVVDSLTVECQTTKRERDAYYAKSANLDSITKVRAERIAQNELSGSYSTLGQWRFYWLIDWVSEWLIDWLSVRLIDWLIDWLASFFRWLLCYV